MMTSKGTAAVAQVLFSMGFGLVWPAIAHSQGQVIQWSGTLDFVAEDSGTGALTGGIPGVSGFDGFFSYPSSCGSGCLVEPFPPNATNYVFSNGVGLIRGLGVSVPGDEASVEVIDEQILDADGVALANFYGVAANVGQSIDVWTLSSENDAEFTPDFVEWNVSYLYLSTDPFTSTDFVSIPPPNADLVIFEVVENDGNAYEGIGEAFPVPVPEPAFGHLLMAGALALAQRKTAFYP